MRNDAGLMTEKGDIGCKVSGVGVETGRSCGV